MEKNKYNCIKNLLNKNIDKLNDYKSIVNNGEPFFEKEDYNTIEGVPIYKDITTKEQIIKDKGYSKCKECF